MMVLNTIMTTPEDTSATRDGTPKDTTVPAALRPQPLRLKWKPFLRLTRWRESTQRLNTGASPVASTAPNIPIPNGKMNT